jgi:hypothetical protein
VRDRGAASLERGRPSAGQMSSITPTRSRHLPDMDGLQVDTKPGVDKSNPWRAEVLARLAVLRAMAESAGERPNAKEKSTLRERIGHLLDETEQQTRAKGQRWAGLKEWRNGGPIERAWRNIHSAEILLADVAAIEELSSQRPAIRSLAKRVLPAKDARAVAIEKRLSDDAWAKLDEDSDGSIERKLRREYAAALTWVNDSCDKNFTRVRSFRNIVLATSLGLALVAIGLGVLGALSPRSLPVCFDAGTLTVEGSRGEASPVRDIVCPTGATSGPTGGDVPLLLVVGLAAGAFGAALAVRGMRGTSTPYGIPVAIAWLKLPAGAVTALLGMLLLRGAFIPGLSALDTQGQIIAYAIVFGYAQEIFTRMVASQAQTVLDGAPSSEPAAATRSQTDRAAVRGLSAGAEV